MKDELGDRMKSYYENRSKTFLARRIPIFKGEDREYIEKLIN